MVNLSCSEQFLRLFVFIFNVAFFIFGVLLIAVGAYAIATVQDFSEFDVDSVKSVSGKLRDKGKNLLWSFGADSWGQLVVKSFSFPVNQFSAYWKGLKFLLSKVGVGEGRLNCLFQLKHK